MPAGVLVTVPEPVPDLLTVRVKVGVGTGNSSNIAETVLAWVMVTVQLEVPEQAPDQPAKTEPAAGLALRLTRVFSSKS